MKKFVTMVMVFVMMLTVAAIAMADSFMPEIYNYYPYGTEDNDDYDLHLGMRMFVPEYGHVMIKINVRFTDDSNHNYTEGTAYCYDENGELVDQMDGCIASDIDCSSRDIETVRQMLYDYAMNYDFESDAKEGIRFYSIWF